MSPDDPRHGSRAGYLAGCHTTCCTEPNFREQKRARLRLLREGTQFVSSTPVTERLSWWADHGVTGNAIQRAAGLGEGTLREMVTTGRDVCLRSTVRAVLAVDWDDLPDRSLCNAALTRARVHSMQAAGHSLDWISDNTDGLLARGGRWRQQDRLTLSIARAVQQLYDRAPLQGPSKLSAARARGRGHLHPLAWDDPGTPAAPASWTPLPPAEPRTAGRPRVIDAVVEDFDFLVSTGVTEEQAAARLGVRYSTVRDYRLRLKKEAS